MDLISQIKEIPILSVAKLLGINVKRNKSLCFMGHDTKPSLSFTPGKNLFYCFGCGIGGSAIDLVKYALGVDKKDAIKWLKNKFIIKTTYESTYKLSKNNKVKKKSVENNAPDVEIYTRLVDELHLSTSGKNYLVSRGFSEETIKKFQIKDLNNPKGVFKSLSQKYGNRRLNKAGLIRYYENKDYLVEKFIWWDHIILFPFFNDRKVTYLQGRRLDDKGPKYIGLKGIPKPLYNINVINKLKNYDLLLICEGIPDVLAAYEMGYNAVGVLGAHSFQSQWVEMLMRFDIVVVPDNDAAGKDFVKKIKNLFLAKNKIIQIYRIQDAKDLSELNQKKI